MQQSRMAYPVSETARLLSLSVRSVRYLIRSGRLAHVRLGRRVLIRHQDIEALLRKRYVKSLGEIDASAVIRDGDDS